MLTHNIFHRFLSTLWTSCKHLIKKTETQSGLKVKANIIDKIYESGKKVSEEFKNNMKIVFDEYLPKWNYTAKCTS